MVRQLIWEKRLVFPYRDVEKEQSSVPSFRQEDIWFERSILFLPYREAEKEQSSVPSFRQEDIWFGGTYSYVESPARDSA